MIRHVLLLQHPSDLDEVIIRKNANLSTSSMEYSSSHLLNRVTDLWNPTGERGGVGWGRGASSYNINIYSLSVIR